MKFDLRARWENYYEPAVLLRFAVYYYVQVLFAHLLQGKFDLDAIRTEAFTKFWLFLSPPASSPEPPPPESPEAPLAASSTSDTSTTSTTDDSDPADRGATIPRLLSLATGTILDIGPGSGSMFEYFSPSTVGKIYGCEPVHSLHPALQSSAEAVGLGEKLVVLGVGAQEGSLMPELGRRGLLPLDGKGEKEGVFDTIVAIRSLCSVPDLEDTLTMLYGLLRPGGKFLVWEHTVVKPFLSEAEQRKAEKRKTLGTPTASLMQHIYTLLGWPYFVGGCQLRKDTIGLLENLADQDGGWASVEIKGEGNRYAVLPFVTGAFVKRG